MLRSEVHTLSDADYGYICQLVYDTSGIVLDEGKREMVYRRLMRRTHELKLARFADYCTLLKRDAATELPHFTNAITTNLTRFFREPHHFDYLRETALPELLLRRSSQRGIDKRIRVWSSACSTGEEPYSAAISIAEAMGPRLAAWDVKILATDLDSSVVAQGKTGVYSYDRIKDLDEPTRRRWFRKGTGDHDGLVKVDRKLSGMVTFKALNLLREWPMSGPFDVIFCRNVLIYFDRKTQAALIPRFFELLRPGGILFLGHSENLPIRNGMFELLGKTTFKKPG